MPWTMNVVSSLTRMLIGLPPRGIQPRVLRLTRGLRPRQTNGELRGFVHRGGPVGVAHAVALEDLEALLLPGAGDAEDRDLLRRVHVELEAGLDDAARDDVDTGVGDDRHHHRDLVDARLAEHQLGEAAGLLDRGVAADLAVVGGLAAVLAHGVEERERAAAGADDEAEV